MPCIDYENVMGQYYFIGVGIRGIGIVKWIYY